jgi:hypothetical protein
MVDFRMVVNWVHHSCWRLIWLWYLLSFGDKKNVLLQFRSWPQISAHVSLFTRYHNKKDFLVLQMEDLNQQEEQFFSLLFWFNTPNFNHYFVSVCAHLLGSLCSCCYSYLKWCKRSPWYKPDRSSLIMKWRIPSDTITSSSSRCKLGQTKILCVLILSILWLSVSNFFGDKSHEAIAKFFFLLWIWIVCRWVEWLTYTSKFQDKKKGWNLMLWYMLLCMWKNLRMQIRVQGLTVCMKYCVDYE